MRLGLLLTFGAVIGWCAFLLVGGIYRVFDDKAGNDSIAGIALAAAVLVVTVRVAVRIWRRHPRDPSDEDGVS